MPSNLIKEIIIVEIKIILNLQPQLAYGVTGNTSGFGPEESRFDP
tara:strand:- start:769 stop:903 length:135 start_codon:yes stop_codon:yes gene_type:complete